MTKINSERLRREFLKLVQIDSPTFKEGKVSRYLQEKLTSLDCEVFVDNAGEKTGGETGNIIARFPSNNGTDNSVMFAAHMDCVPPCEGVNPVVEGTMVKTDGKTVLGGDDKAGIAAILELLEVLKESDIPHGPVEILFDIAEEGGLFGVKHLDLTQFKSKAGYCLDSDKIDELTLESPGAYRIDYTIKGKASHAGVEPDKGISAILIASKAISRMKLGKIDDETTANVGAIKGGSATNIITPEVFIKAEARSRNEEKLEQQVESMTQAFLDVIEESAITIDGEVFKAELVEKRDHDYPPMKLTEDSLVFTLAKEAAIELGIEMKPVVSGGGTDANILNSSGMEVSVIGVGMAKVHTTEEYIDLKDIEKAAELILQVVIKARDYNF
ncbi:MAG: M20/M25/M40 family metallo-hydrolase [FCB group bacterium]|nr:M20/M25/M40 family metallo-hydrolase [FCB group bacterium]